MLNGFKLIEILLNVMFNIILNVVMLLVVILNVIMFSGIILSVSCQPLLKCSTCTSTLAYLSKPSVMKEKMLNI
jgi:hypothetical protein